VFYTYLHCKPDGTPFYVGKGADRYVVGHGTDQRSRSKKNRSRYHRNVTAKYGWENVLVYVFPCVSEAQALADEVQQIAQLRREGHVLCNLTAGGEGCSGMEVTVETRLKIAAALQGKKRPPRSAEWAAKIAAANKGQVPSPQTQLAATKAKQSPEFRAHQAEMKRGKLASAETKAKMSAAKTGKSVSHKGKPWSEARRAAQEKRSI
jgi:hypothetical protein